MVALVGCGRTRFEELARDAPTPDAPTLEAPSCWPRWFAGTFAFDQPRGLSELLPGTLSHADPSLAGGDLELFYSRSETPSVIYLATRAARGMPWQNPTKVTDLDLMGGSYRVTIARDDRTVVFTSDRNGNLDLYTAPRSGASFGPVGTAEVAALQTTDQEKNPELTVDGLGLYFTRQGASRRELYASRQTLGAPFGAATVLSELLIPGLAGIGDASISPDGRVIVYVAGNGPFAPYYATRASASAPFGAGQPIPGLSSPQGELDMEVSSDGCEVYFSSTRDRITLTDLYVATQPL